MNPFQIPTVAGAVAPLLKVLKNLEAVVKASAKAVNTNNTEISRLHIANDAANVELASANQIIKALGGIVNYGPKAENVKG